MNVICGQVKSANFHLVAKMCKKRDTLKHNDVARISYIER